MRQAHLDHKSIVTLRKYNLTCNHRRKILHTTEGHPARWNDKTLIRSDNFMSELHVQVKDMTRNDKWRQQWGQDTQAQRCLCNCWQRGSWVVNDSAAIEIILQPIQVKVLQWLESMRKDVECTFEILKGRWRILKSGIRLYNTETADNVWLTTCCALHNMLLDVDGLSKSWNNGVCSSGEFGADNIPLAIHRLVDPTGTEEFRLRQYDRSLFGYQRPPTLASDDEQDDDGSDESENDDDDGNRGYHRNRRCNGNHNITTASCRMHWGHIESGVAINKLHFFQFRLLLIDSFNIRFHKNNVQWPRRLAHSAPRHAPPALIVAAWLQSSSY